MKKKVLIVLFILTIFASGVIVDKLLFSNNDIDDGFNDINKIEHKNMLSMMLEQTAGVGDYSLETRSSWPTKEDGYVFNSTLSKCERGSQLRWDEENNAVLMVGTTSDKCYVYFDVYAIPTIVESDVTSSYDNKTITISISSTSDDIVKYYYSKDNGVNYIESDANTITFNNLSEEYYNIKYYVVDKYGISSDIFSKKVYFVLLANWVKSQYTGTQGENNLYYHDSNLANGANDNSYRYAGSSDTTNNFVCFGSDATTCPDDNLYRIIGVFEDQVKLIKWDYATSTLLGTDGDYKSSCSADSDCVYGINNGYYKGSNTAANIGVYYWNEANYDASYSATNYYNDWSYSELNKTHLNKNFLTNIGTTWANMIDKTVWKVGGFADADNVPSKVYKNEITSPSTQVTSTYESKVGLMYVSDYAFAAAPTAWTTTLYNYEESDASGNKITEENWMYMGLYEWTMARSSSYSYTAYYVSFSGFVGYIPESFGYLNSIVNVNAWGARPVFHLLSSIIYDSGTGTKTNPYRIKLD